MANTTIQKKTKYRNLECTKITIKDDPIVVMRFCEDFRKKYIHCVFKLGKEYI